MRWKGTDRIDMSQKGIEWPDFVRNKRTIYEGFLSCNIPLTFTRFVDFFYIQYYEVNTTFRKLCSRTRETGLFTDNGRTVFEIWTSPNTRLWNYDFSKPVRISHFIINGTRSFFSDVSWNIIMHSIISLLVCLCLAAPFGLKCERNLLRHFMSWTLPPAQITFDVQVPLIFISYS
jgi:hypothetical protein